MSCCISIRGCPNPNDFLTRSFPKRGCGSKIGYSHSAEYRPLASHRTGAKLLEIFDGSMPRLIANRRIFDPL